jgi:L-ascorbate metabolism protein UlaG (beta-lactamase superfamily)
MRIGNIELSWLGHATFMAKGSKILYTDPYILPANPEKADIILITHDHFDHCAPDKVKQIQRENTVIVATADCLPKLAGDVRAIVPGQEMDLLGVRIKAVPAYNSNKSFHPRAHNWVGYLFTIDQTKIYIAGDTDFIPEMKGLAPDIALLPIGGTYTMNIDEAVQAAIAIGPKTVVPMHYDTFDGIHADPNEFKKKVTEANPGISVELL